MITRRLCAHCGEAPVKKSESVYCSRRCSALATNAKRGAVLSSDIQALPCVQCGSAIPTEGIAPSIYLDRKFCSRSCSQLTLRGTAGELNNVTLGQRFWSKTERRGQCIVWTRYIDASGYGRCRYDKSIHLAHRLSYAAAKGPIPSGMQVDHLCRVTACVNPDHLELVTPTVNKKREWAARKAVL